MKKEKLKELIFSNELNQRITSAICDENFPNSGSVKAGLVQEEIYIQFEKEGIFKRKVKKK